MIHWGLNVLLHQTSPSSWQVADIVCSFHVDPPPAPPGGYGYTSSFIEEAVWLREGNRLIQGHIANVPDSITMRVDPAYYRVLQKVRLMLPVPTCSFI